MGCFTRRSITITLSYASYILLEVSCIGFLCLHSKYDVLYLNEMAVNSDLFGFIKMPVLRDLLHGQSCVRREVEQKFQSVGNKVILDL